MVEEKPQEINEHEEEEKDQDKPEDEDESKVDKSFEDQFLDQLNTIVESQSVLIETQKALGETVIALADRVKAMENPTDLPMKPAGTAASDDVGVKVNVPEKPYQQGHQAHLDADGDGIESGDKKLEIQGTIGKSDFNFTTETPRPNAALETVNKSYSEDFSPILKDARSVGYEGLSDIARNILTGKYYVPSEEERF